MFQLSISFNISILRNPGEDAHALSRGSGISLLGQLVTTEESQPIRELRSLCPGSLG